MNSLERIKQAEEMISNALWNSVNNQDYEKELQEYEKAKKLLEEVDSVSCDVGRERDRVLSFCLMRIDNTLVALGDKKGGVKRMEEALQIAVKSEDKVQIARCFAALGARLAGIGSAEKAEENWGKAITIADCSADYDMQQIVGWTFISRARFLNQQGKRAEALETAKIAEEKLKAIENYAGVANANALMAEIYKVLGDQRNEQRCKKIGEDYMDKAKTEQK